MISYSGLTNYGKASLPSVSSWGTNNNILRDPPKSITTQRKDKVGDNSFITEEIDCASDRASDAIMVYPRGINPMVGVSYTNFTGGVGRGQAHLYINQGQGKLPYRVANQGAFRPPILAPVDLLPLSRMPRLVTHIDPIIYQPDYSKKLTCGAEARSTKNIITYSVEGVETYKPDGYQKTLHTSSKINKVALKGEMSSTRAFMPDKYQMKRNVAPYLNEKLRGEMSTSRIFGADKYQKEKYTAPFVKEQLEGEMYSQHSGNQVFIMNSDQISSLRATDSILRPTAATLRTFISGKDQRSRHVEPLLKQVLKGSTQSALSKNTAGGQMKEDLRGPPPIISKRRGAILLPAGLNTGTRAGTQQNLEYNSINSRARFIPVARAHNFVEG